VGIYEVRGRMKMEGSKKMNRSHRNGVNALTIGDPNQTSSASQGV